MTITEPETDYAEHATQGADGNWQFSTEIRLPLHAGLTHAHPTTFGYYITKGAGVQFDASSVYPDRATFRFWAPSREAVAEMVRRCFQQDW